MTRSKSSPTNRGRKEPAQPAPTWDERLIGQLLPWRRELAGLLLFVVAVITLLALLNLTQADLLSGWTKFLRQLAGWGVYPMSLIVVALGLYLILSRFEGVIHISVGQVIGLELALLTVLALVHLVFGGGLEGALSGRGGGVIGWALSDPLLYFLGPFLTGLFLLLLTLLSLALIVRLKWADIIRWLNRASLRLQLWSNELEVDIAQREAHLEARTADSGQVAESETALVLGEADLLPATGDQLVIIDDSAAEAVPKPRKRDQHLPPITVLEEGGVIALAPEEIDLKKQII